MSMIGLARRPGTDVDPVWCTSIAKPSSAVSMHRSSCAYSCGHSLEYGTRTIATTRAMLALANDVLKPCETCRVQFRLTRPEPEQLRSLVEGGAFDDLSYELVGLSKLAEAPSGFTMDRHTCALGHGDAVFHKAVEALREWQVHRGSGIVVLADDEPRLDLVVAMSAPLPVGFIDLACRVVDTVDQDD